MMICTAVGRPVAASRPKPGGITSTARASSRSITGAISRAERISPVRTK
jgi:hypothetical protein